MSDIAIRMDHVFKKFRKGQIYNSLRDLLPALTGKMFGQGDLSATDKREFWALQDLCFEVKAGHAFGIIGHNGAGKSTALKILSRIMKPTKGSMHVQGRLSALIEVTAGFHQDLTGRENIFLQGTILGMPRREIAAKLDQIIAFSGIEEFIDTPVKRYSTGMYARLGFSVAAHVDPQVLIVDEVLSVGDYLFQQKCVERMREVLRGGTAVVFVSHNLKIVADFCDRCLLLEHGRTVASGSSKDVIRQYMAGVRTETHRDETKEVEISAVRMRNAKGDNVRFESGEAVWVDVEVIARRPCAKLSVALAFRDDSDNEIFNTSTERLGSGNFSLEPQERFSCTFALKLNLASGTFRLVAVIYRYDNETLYDRWGNAACFYVWSAEDVGGAVNCFPKVVKYESLGAKKDVAASCDSY